jgi:hypothetical protein
MMRILLIAILVVLSTIPIFAQEPAPYYLDNRGKDALLAPRIGLGAGFFTYLGDVQDNNINHPFTSSWGYEFLSSANISRYFDLNLNITYGDITVNERSTTVDSNRNFRSELFVGGVGVSYNFNHLYKKPGIVQPFVSVGVAFIHFDSHTDLKDANGNIYHYWSDGSIMNIAENSEQAGQAIELQRDYTYESDLRQMNNDGLGKYDLFTFSVPVSLGLDFKMGRRMSGRLSSSFYYTFSDLVDDFTWRGNGNREGNKANDMFLYTSMSVSYSIGVKSDFTKTEKSKAFEAFDFYALNIADSDGDGINDFDDQCANTGEGIQVDELGCPLDTDRDLIADFRDKEEMTSIEKIANLEGIGLTDQMMLANYLDSMSLERARIAATYPNGVLEKKEQLNIVKNKEAAISSVKEETVANQSIADVVNATVMATNNQNDKKSENSELKNDTQNVSSKNNTINSTASSTEKSADVEKLSQIMSDIALGAGKSTPTSMLMDEFAKEVFNGSAEDASNVDEVYNAAYRVYGKMVDDGKITESTSVHISRNSASENLIPEAYKLNDFNDDGLITSDEVLKAIEDVIDGNSLMSPTQVYGLISFYKEYMQDARVVDFGGTKAVYVAGKLNILDNYSSDNLSANQRFLVKKFPGVDFNGDGKLTADEVNRAISEYQSGRSVYSVDDINQLIDLFFED